MTRFMICTILLALVSSGSIMAQLSGTYTVGGVSPDFTTPQDAADMLMTVGVSGSVEILIRPGVYEGGTDGDGPALNIDRQIVGSDRSNRVAFRADRAAGGDTSNVILRRRLGGTVVSLVTNFGQLQMSHITLDGFAAVVADTVAGVNELGAVINMVGQGRGIRLEDMEITGMKIDGGERRSQFAIRTNECTSDLRILANRITESATATEITCFFGSGFRFERNRVDNSGVHGAGATNVIKAVVLLTLGDAIGPVVSDNVIDMSGECSQWALRLTGGTLGLRLERNQVVRYECGGGNGAQSGGAIAVQDAEGYTVVINNMVSLGTAGTPFRDGGPSMSLHQQSDSMLVAHNTAYAYNKARGPRVEADEANGAHARILNNIFVATNQSAFDPRGSFTRDYNILSNGTDLGPNSFVATPEFVDPASDLHLGECAFEDNTLHGLAGLGVLDDFDREARSLVAPFRGADEPGGAPPPVFSGPALFDSGMESFLMASGDLDNDGDVDLAVTNVEAGNGSNDVTLLWNDGAGSFSDPEHLAFGSVPTHIEMGHLNQDDLLDLVVVASDGVYQRVGLGGTSFADPVQVAGPRSYTDLELADYDNDGDADILLTDSPPGDSAFVVVHINDGLGSYTFINAARFGEYADDLEMADLDGDGFLDLVVVDNTSTNQLYTARNLGNQSPGVSLGFDTPVPYMVSVESVPAASQFLIGDFDRDSDLDLILGDATADSLVLLRNSGDGTFGAREAFGVPLRGAPRIVSMLDYEGDNDLDLVVASSVSAVDLLLNDGTARFGRIALCGSGALSGFPNAMLATNLDTDMSTDVAVLTSNDTVEILTNLNWISPISTEEPEPLPSADSQLHPNYPNPFARTTTVSYNLGESAKVRLTVFDLLGRQVATIDDGFRPAGRHSVTFDGSGLASGVYLYRIAAGEFVDSGRMMVVR